MPEYCLFIYWHYGVVLVYIIWNQNSNNIFIIFTYAPLYANYNKLIHIRDVKAHQMCNEPLKVTNWYKKPFLNKCVLRSSQQLLVSYKASTNGGHWTIRLWICQVNNTVKTVRADVQLCLTILLPMITELSDISRTREWYNDPWLIVTCAIQPNV